MSDIDWRIWLWDRLRGSSSFTDLVPEFNILGAGSLTGVPEVKPFVVLHIGDELYEMPGVTRTLATVFAHDEPGNYLLVDEVLKTTRTVLCGPGQTTGPVYPPPSGGIAVKWDGDGPDQSDEGFQTVMRRSTFSLIGRNGNA